MYAWVHTVYGVLLRILCRLGQWSSVLSEGYHGGTHIACMPVSAHYD